MAFLRSVNETFSLTDFQAANGQVNVYKEIDFSQLFGVTRVLSATAVIQALRYSVWGPNGEDRHFWQLKYGIDTQLYPSQGNTEMTVVKVKGVFAYRGANNGSEDLVTPSLADNTFQFSCVAVCV